MFRKKNREISIFSLSYLDVLSGALAVFIIIVMILIPYYKSDLRDELATLKEKLREAGQKISGLEEENRQVREEGDAARAERGRLAQENRDLQTGLNEARSQNEELEAENRQLAGENQGLREAGKKTFLIVMISWDTGGDDVDLHVLTPERNEYYFSKKVYPGFDDRLSEDDKSGPGIEVYENYEARPGIYSISYNFYSDGGARGPAKVKGRIFYKDGNMQLGYKTLNRVSEKKLVVKIRVTEEGGVERLPD